MRLAWVMGKVTLDRRLEELKPGALLICEAVDAEGLEEMPRPVSRVRPMPESWVVYDRLGAGEGDLIAVSEGREAAAPFQPDRVPVDSYCAAILDSVDVGRL